MTRAGELLEEMDQIDEYVPGIAPLAIAATGAGLALYQRHRALKGQNYYAKKRELKGQRKDQRKAHRAELRSMRRKAGW